MGQSAEPQSKQSQAAHGAGLEFVPITVQWRGARPPGDDRSTRKANLRQALEVALSSHPAVDVDWGSVSLSAQTVEGHVPFDQLDAVVEELQDGGLRVDVVIDRQVVDP